MTLAIDVELYHRAAGVSSIYQRSGGQALVLNEIAAAFAGCRYIWLPFRCDGQLENKLYSLGFQTHCSDEDFVTHSDFRTLPAGVDAVYFGTPTLVGDKVLFPHSTRFPDFWNLDRERTVARAIRERAELLHMKRIVSGLGTGDVSVHERMTDMGEGSLVICYKRFNDPITGAGFDDFVLMRELK